ncbi:hypothetical protein Mapa_005700 [Marchantia paleacea]|nr:hypothetical protein Mapa_005700 [Marchantia paleacea]
MDQLPGISRDRWQFPINCRRAWEAHIHCVNSSLHFAASFLLLHHICSSTFISRVELVYFSRISTGFGLNFISNHLLEVIQTVSTVPIHARIKGLSTRVGSLQAQQRGLGNHHV